MKPKTEEFLFFLLWSCDMLLRPTPRHLSDSFESWAYRGGLQRQLEELERRKLIESSREANSNERLWRLTEAGRVHALLGRDPEKQWARAWDGKWRLVMFDMPAERDAERKRLWYYLRQRHFGLLQRSVWISPDALDEQREILKSTTPNAKMVTLLEANPCGGETTEDIVTAAWDFAGINQRYADYLELLAHRPTGNLSSAIAAQTFRKWANDERTAWAAAVKIDPFLPEQALPKNYAGKKAWQARVQAMTQAGKQIRSFRRAHGD
jgi:phenylacetic acid degradation operon negative regulatory protein